MTEALPPFWRGEGFLERLQAWIVDERPDMALISTVAAWIDATLDNPYGSGLDRNLDVLPNLWWGPVPGTERIGTAVHCGIVVFELERLIRCDSIVTLSR